MAEKSFSYDKQFWPAAPKGRKPGKPKHGKSKSVKFELATLPKSPFVVCPVQAAVAMLTKNAVSVTETKGATAHTSTTYPSDILAAARSMFPAGKVYNFEIHANGTIQSSGGGVINTRVSWDPSVNSFAEWTALAALFDECNSNFVQIDITSAFGPTSTAIITQLMIAPDRDAISGASPSFTTVQRLAESEPFHVYNMGTKTSPGVFHKIHHIHRSRPWATTSVPGGAAGTPSGLIGQFSIASNIVSTATTNQVFWVLKHNVALRNRA